MADTKFVWYGGNGAASIEEIREEIEKQLANIDLTGYVKEEDLGSYAKKEELVGLVKTEDLGAYLKRNELVAGNGIGITEDLETKRITIAYTGQAGGITEEQARQIASEQAAAKISESNLASKDDLNNLASKDEIPKKISDLTNDSGFVKTSELSPVATSGNYSDITGTPDPYDDSELRGLITNMQTKIQDLETAVENLSDPSTPTPPTITQPSLSISGTDSGTTISAGQTKNVAITLTFDRGTISSGGNTAGAATGYSLNGGAYQASNVFNVTVSETNKAFKGKVRFGQGDQPKDSSGANYGTPMAANEIESSTLTYTFAASDPPADDATIWSNAANISQVVKMTNVKESDKQWTVDWVPQTEEEPEIFDVPASWNVIAVETINNLTNQWAPIGGSFDISDTTHDGVAYKRYTDNREYDDSGRSIRVTWA